MEPVVLASVAASAALGGFTQGFAGFGSTVIAIPLMCLVLGVREAVPLGCLMALSMNVALVARLHGQTAVRPLRLLVLASLPGMAAGAYVLLIASDDALRALLGVCVAGLAVRNAFTAGPSRILGPGWAVAVGLVSGCLGVTIGVNGPPVVAWTSSQPWDRMVQKATLAGYFLLAGACMVGVQAWQGQVTGRVLALFGAALPAMLAGLWAGYALCGRVSDRAFRQATAWFLATMGVWLCAQALMRALR